MDVAAAELEMNLVSKHQIQPEYGDEQADAGRDCRNRLARPNSQARMGTGKNYSSCIISLPSLSNGSISLLQYNTIYKGSERGGLSAPPSSVVGNALVVIDDDIESVNVKNRYQGARVSARRANREPEDGTRWKYVHGRVVVVR